MKQRLKDLAQALGTSLAIAAKTGQVAAERSVIEARSKVCEKCPQYTGSRCRACGCFIAAKVALTGSTCPLSKWSA